MTEQSEHLSSAQIENYGDRTSGAGPDAAQRDDHQRVADQRMADRHMDDQSTADQSTADQSIIDQRSNDQRTNDQRIEAHLADCPSCRTRVLDFHRHRFALLPESASADATFSGPGLANSKSGDERPPDSALADSKFANSKLADSKLTNSTLANSSHSADTQMRTAATPECPSDDALRQLAAGLTPDALAAQLTQHAATCDHCGPLLRTFTEDFSDDFTPAEQAALDTLKSSSADWQKNTARQMLEAGGVSAASPAEVGGSVASAAMVLDKKSSAERHLSSPLDRKPFFWKWVLIPIAAAVALAAITFPVYLARRDTPQKAEGYLAQAYTQKRTIEMRWPGAEWGRPQIILGPSESVLSKPSPLIDAEKMIKDHETASGDSKWLRARAEVEILEGNPQNAIGLLAPAVHANPDSVPLRLDLALAYSQQFRNSGDRKDSQTAIDELKTVLKKEPENRTALFNLALAYADNEMWDEVVSTWDRYLQIETDPKWAAEAQEKRQKAQEEIDKARKKLHSTSQYPPSPSDLVTSFLALNDQEIAFRLEQYQEIALRSWLAKAIANPAGLEHQAVKRLALVSKDHSADPWWHDFLDAASNRDASGIEALRAAFVDNIKGLYAEATDKSLRASRIFKQQRNLPGELRARLESVYAQRRLLNGKNCLSRAGPLRAQLALTSYTWLQSQLSMEIAVCLNYVDQLKESSIALSQSLSLAQKSDLPIAVLRNIGFAQSLDNQQGHYRSALDEGVKGLHNYWQGPPSPERIYQFYTGFSRSAQALGLWAAAEAFMRHAIDLLQAEEDDIQKGAAWFELSRILAAEKEDDAAEAAARKANQLFDSQLSEPTSRRYRLVGKIGLAEFQLLHGKKEVALETLAPARELLSETDGYFVSLNFYRLSGNINLALGLAAHGKAREQFLNEATSAYQQAILIAERALPGLASNQKRLEWIGASEDAYRGLVRVLIKCDQPEDAWKLWEWYISRSYPEDLITVAGGKRHPIAAWSELWATISAIPVEHDEATRVVYAIFDDGMEVWTTAHDKLKAAWVPVHSEDLQRMAQQFSQACAHRDSPLTEVQKLGQELFALFVQPVSAELPVTSLIRIELDRSLSGLPIEALRSPAGWYFGEKYPIVQSPGMLYERHLRPAVNLPSNTSFLLADAAADGYLPGHDLELSTIQKLFPKVKILGSKTDSAAIMSTLGQNAIFGFIGHGEPYTNGAGLRINPNLLLKAEDFSPQTLHHLQLAVLAACSTGSSGNDGFLDNRSLLHAFLAGGVPGILASRWNVDSQATADTMSDFYTALARNESAPNALFSARNQLLKTYSHPYYWAGFSVTGKAN